MSTMRLGRIIGITLLLLAFIPCAHADLYKVKVTRITSQSDSGDVDIRFKPGNKEKRFKKTAKAMLLAADPGTNKSLAVLLTVVSTGKEALIELEFIPSKNTQAVISTRISP